MVRYLSTQHPNKNPGHQHNGKNGVKNGKKEEDSKFEDKENNATETAGAHVGDVTTPEDSTAFSGISSIGSHVIEAVEQPFWPT